MATQPRIAKVFGAVNIGSFRVSAIIAETRKLPMFTAAKTRAMRCCWLAIQVAPPCTTGGLFSAAQSGQRM
jgi:hypothetical protein